MNGRPRTPAAEGQALCLALSAGLGEDQPVRVVVRPGLSGGVPPQPVRWTVTRSMRPAKYHGGPPSSTLRPAHMPRHHRYAASKTVEVYPFNGHEGGGRVHESTQLAFVHDRIG